MQPGRILPLLACLLLLAPAAAEAEPLAYNRDIRPILAENCFACHGPDSASRKAELRLDVREDAIEMGAIEAGDLDASELIARIFSEDPEELMPPPETMKSLSADEKAKLKQWIADGAEYQPHWSLIPPQKLTPPAVRDEAWIKNPLDRFVLARLEVEGLAPAPAAGVMAGVALALLAVLARRRRLGG